MKKCIPITQVLRQTTTADIKELKELASLSKALSHYARLHIVRTLISLEEKQACLNSTFVSDLGLASSTIFEHLRILKNANLIKTTLNPPNVCYQINKKTLETYQAYLEQFLHINVSFSPNNKGVQQ